MGTGMAWNPDDDGAGFFVDVFTAPIPSYPHVGYSEKDIFIGAAPLAPDTDATLVMTVTRDFFTTEPTGLIQFSLEEINTIKSFYVKVDTDNLVPESNEMNNLGIIHIYAYRIYLPLICRKCRLDLPTVATP